MCIDYNDGIQYQDQKNLQLVAYISMSEDKSANARLEGKQAENTAISSSPTISL